MKTNRTTPSQDIQELLLAARIAMEDSRYEEAANHLQAALALQPSGDEEAIIRCELSESFERRSLDQEQLEAVVKYDRSSDFARLGERTQMRLLIHLGRAFVLKGTPRAIANFNQSLQ